MDGADYSVESPRTVRAYFGNAIDAAGIFPSLIYSNVDQTTYLGLDRIGSAVVEKQPGYAYYWYTDYDIGPPDVSVFVPPDVCVGSESFVGDATTIPKHEEGSEPSASPVSEPTGNGGAPSPRPVSSAAAARIWQFYSTVFQMLISL